MMENHQLRPIVSHRPTNKPERGGKRVDLGDRMSFRNPGCPKHPSQQVVGVCASCLKDRLTAVSSVDVRRFHSPRISFQPFVHAGETCTSSSSHMDNGSEGNKGLDNWQKKTCNIRRSRSLCEGRVCRATEDASPQILARDGQVGGGKRTLRFLFDLDDAKRPETEILCEEEAKGFRSERIDVRGVEGSQVRPINGASKEPTQAIQNKAAKNDEYVKQECNPGSAASEGGKHLSWLAYLFCRKKKARQKSVKVKVDVANASKALEEARAEEVWASSTREKESSSAVWEEARLYGEETPIQMQRYNRARVKPVLKRHMRSESDVGRGVAEMERSMVKSERNYNCAAREAARKVDADGMMFGKKLILDRKLDSAAAADHSAAADEEKMIKQDSSQPNSIEYQLQQTMLSSERGDLSGQLQQISNGSDGSTLKKMSNSWRSNKQEYRSAEVPSSVVIPKDEYDQYRMWEANSLIYSPSQSKKSSNDLHKQASRKEHGLDRVKANADHSGLLRFYLTPLRGSSSRSRSRSMGRSSSSRGRRSGRGLWAFFFY